MDRITNVLISMFVESYMRQFNPDLLNRHIAPGISEFVTAEVPDLRPSFPEAEHWLANLFLNSMFGTGFAGKTRQYAINMIARAQSQFALYHEARDATSLFLRSSTPDNPSLRNYYAAVIRWEACFLNLEIFMDLFVKSTDQKAFRPGDGSEEQRAYDMANAIKHWGGTIKDDKHDDRCTIPMWLSSAGFHTQQNSLTFAEFAGITKEVAKTANDLQHPASFKTAT